MVKVAVLGVFVSSVIVTLSEVRDDYGHPFLLFHSLGENKELEAVRSVHRLRYPPGSIDTP